MGRWLMAPTDATPATEATREEALTAALGAAVLAIAVPIITDSAALSESDARHLRLALVENGHARLAHVEAVPAAEILAREVELLAMARRAMARSTAIWLTFTVIGSFPFRICSPPRRQKQRRSGPIQPKAPIVFDSAKIFSCVSALA